MAAHSARLAGPHGGLRELAQRLRPRRGAHAGPRVALALPPFARGERVLIAERDSAGGPVVATTHALYHYALHQAEPPDRAPGEAPGEPPGEAPTNISLGDPPARHRAENGDAGWRRLAWEDVGRVGWDSVRRSLDLTALGSGDPVAVRLPQHTPLVDLVRDRVGATLVVSRWIPVGDDGTVLLTGRRRPGATAVTWVVLVRAGGDPVPIPNGSGPDGTSAARAAVSAAVAGEIRRLRAELSL